MRRTQKSGWGHQTCSEAQCCTPTDSYTNLLLQLVWCPLMINVLSVDGQVTLLPLPLMPSVMTGVNFATFPTRFLHQEHQHHQGRSCSRHQYTHNWRDRSHFYYCPRHRRLCSRSQFLPLSTLWQKQQHYKAPPCTLFIHYSSSCCPSANGCFQYPSCPQDQQVIVAPHPALTISPKGVTHITPQTRAGLTSAAPATQPKNLSPGMSSNTQECQLPINPTTPKLSPFKILLQTLLQILKVSLIL